MISAPGKERVRMSGVDAVVIGDVWGNFNATDSVLTRLDEGKPDVVLVAGMHPWSHKRYQADAWKTPIVQRPQDEDLFVRAKFTNYFKKIFPEQMIWYYDTFGVFYSANFVTRVCMPDVSGIQSGLSACYWACENERAKLIAAGAPPLLAQELLATQFSVDQLRDMYTNTLQEVKQRSLALGAEVPDYDCELYERVTGIAKELYGSELLTHRQLYTSAVLHKACQAFKNPVLLQDDQILQSTIATCKMPKLPVYSELYKPIAYTDTLESLLEKLAILTYLDDNTFKRHCDAGVCPVGLLYQGQFAAQPVSKVLQVFNFFVQKYKSMFEDLFMAEIARIPSVYTEGRSLPRLSKTLAVIETRESSVVSHIVQQEIEAEHTAQALFLQIEQNIKDKMAAGISQSKEILAIQQANRGELTSVNKEILRRLMFEANEQLQLVKFPEDFEQYKKYMRWGVSAGDLKKYMHKDFQATAYLAPGLSMNDPEGYFMDPENPPKPITPEERKHFAIVLGKGALPIDISTKSLEEIKSMGGEVIGEIEGEATRHGLEVTKAREKKRQLGDMLTKSGLINSEQ